MSKSLGFAKMAVMLGCCSHFVGNPSKRCPLSLSCCMKGFQTDEALRLFWNVSALPMMMSPLRARDRRTLSLCGALINPTSPLTLLLVKLAITISLSSPWKLS
jgi:hypothetical protein